MNKLLIRLFDIVFSFAGLLILFPVFFVITLCLFSESKYPFIIQQRVGKNQKTFKIYKYRTMKLDTIETSTHKVSSERLTAFGKILRKTKIDELPQLLNVFIGNMSLVGPRPNLLTQIELTNKRNKKNIYEVKPGITGLSQIRKIDMSTPQLLVETDYEMIKSFSLIKYFQYIFLTIFGKGQGDIINEK